MKLIVRKENNDIIIKIETSKGESDFDYVAMIDYIYQNQNNQIELTFLNDVSEDEKVKIQELFNEIHEVLEKRDQL